jgi:hypothetical protein
MKTVADEGVGVRACDDVDRAAGAAIPAARAAARHALLAPECQAAATASAGFDVDVNFVDEHGIWQSGNRVIESLSRSMAQSITRFSNYPITRFIRLAEC